LPLALLLCVGNAAQAFDSACGLDQAGVEVRVDYVHDGDTVRLDDGRSVRLIGINTPELGRDGRPDEPLAIVARDRLRHMLRSSGMRLTLRYDLQRHDRYRRTLAHAYLADGRSVTALLLREGLAMALMVPPNDWHWSCYRDHERAARAQDRGLWGLASQRPAEADRPRSLHPGFTLLHGTVDAVDRFHTGTRVRLIGNAQLWIGTEERDRFQDLQAWLGKRIEARGWLRRRSGTWQMRVRHPAALEALDSAVIAR